MNTDKIYAESVVNEYTKKDNIKIVQLKKLDNKAKLPSRIFAYTFGSFMALILGLGMCLSMNVINSSSNLSFVFGIIIGIIGIIGVSINYPIYLKIRKNGINKYANDILVLAKQIAEEE